jgi:hypothetical protein
MRKSVVVFAAVLALGSLSLGTDAFARAGKGGGGHGGGRGGGHAVRGPSVAHGPRVGRTHAGNGHPTHFVRGHDRHFWHGRWYNYGVGPCWVWSDDYSEYVWVCF